MSGNVLTLLEISAFKNNPGKVASADVKDLIATVEAAWAERDYYRGLVDEIWDEFHESKLIDVEQMR